jgi:hypothetical protein
MAINDKLVSTLKYRETGTSVNEFDNVFAYQITSGGGDTFDFNTKFLADVLPDIAAVVSVSTIFYELYTINLDNPVDFALATFNTLGGRSGDYLPRYNAWAFRYARTTRDVNDGRKAFGMVAETDQVNGAANGAVITLLSTLATQLTVDLVTVAATYRPRIWRRAGVYGPYTGVPPVGTTYPDTFYPISVVSYRQLSTQNSRKR